MVETRRHTDDVPDAVIRRLREICLALPDVAEERAWVGTRWVVRKRTFAHVQGVDVADEPPFVALVFRSSGTELEALRKSGPPFFPLSWGRTAIGMVLDDATDWDDVRELMIESYCVQAPKKLVALVDRPTLVDDAAGIDAAARRPES